MKFMCVVESDTVQEFAIKTNEKKRCSVNGCEVTDRVIFDQGENLFVFTHFGSGEDREFIFEKGAELCFKEISFGDGKACCEVRNLEMNNLCFAWAYPDIDPYKDTDSREVMEKLLYARTLSDIKDMLPEFVCAEVCDVCVSSEMRNYQYGRLSGNSIDPSLKLPLSFDDYDRFVRNERSIQSAAMIRSRGSFECDDPILNNIYKMCTTTALACMSDTYVDCPGFEQIYWIGDAKVTSHVNMVNFGAYAYQPASPDSVTHICPPGT